MTSSLPTLPRARPDPYRPDVPRQPKSFRVDSVFITPVAPIEYLPTGPQTAVPTRFEAHFALDTPAANVTIEVFVDQALGPVVQSLQLRPKGATTSVGTTLLRQVPVDQLVQHAVAEATVTTAAQAEPQPPHHASPDKTGPATYPQEPTPTASERTRAQSDEDARTAARLWSNAVASGSKRPGIEVAEAMNRSRAQVARYVRRARELGLLPPRQDSTVDKESNK